jgi:hypothetical protein
MANSIDISKVHKKLRLYQRKLKAVLKEFEKDPTKRNAKRIDYYNRKIKKLFGS